MADVQAPTKLVNRNAVLVWQGQLFSLIGMQLAAIALLYWVLETTGSATLMGLIMMAASLPGAVLGPFAGTLADNVSRKMLIVSMDVVRGLAALAFVLALVYLPAEDALVVLFVMQVLFGLSGSVFNAALGASVPDIVPKAQLTTANSIMQGTAALSSTLGMGAGGFLYAVVGAPLLFLANGVGYLLSAASEAFARIPRVAKAEPLRMANLWRTFRRDTADGLRFVFGNPGLRKLFLVVAVLNSVLMPTAVALPILVRDFLGSGPELLGVLGAAQSLAMLLGFVLTGALPVPPQKRVLAVGFGMVMSTVTVAAVGWLTSPTAVVIAYALFGLAIPFVNVNIITVVQGTTPTEMRGRVMGVLSTIAMGLIPIAQGLAGFLIDAIDQQVPLIFYGAGAIMLTITLYLNASPAYRRFIATPLQD